MAFHYYDQREYEEENPLANFAPYKVDKDGIIGIETQTWTKILIGISKSIEMLKFWATSIA